MIARRIACDIVIPVYNKADITIACLDSILKNTEPPYTVTIIDNGSDFRNAKLLDDYRSSHGVIALHRNRENLGWVKAVNQGIRLLKAPYVCIMNNDTVVETGDWLYKMIEVAEKDSAVGMVNPRFGDEKSSAYDHLDSVEIDFCRGYCVLIKRAVIDKIGGLDEAYGLGYYDDDDYSVRAIRAGFKCVRANRVVVRHLRDSTFSELFPDEKRRELHGKNRELFYSRWGRRLRIVFILTKDMDGSKASDILMGLARRQHIIYLWNRSSPLGVAHINIRERREFRALPRIAITLLLICNRMKAAQKRYDLIFVDDERIRSQVVRSAGERVFCVDIDNDKGRVDAIVDAASGMERCAAI